MRALLPFVLVLALATGADAQLDGPPFGTPSDDRQQEEEASGPAPLSQRLDRWKQRLDAVEAELKEGPPAPERIESMIAEVTRVREAASGARPEAQQALDDAQHLAEAIAPADGGAEGEGEAGAEAGTGAPSTVTEQRRQVEERLTRARSRLQRVDLVIARAETLLDRISSVRFSLIADTLLTRGPPLFSGRTWATAGSEGAARLTRVVEAPAEWWNAGAIEDRRAEGALQVTAIAALLALAAGVWQWGRLRRYGRVPMDEQPSSDRRALAAAVEALRHAGLPVLFLWVVYAVLESQGLLIGFFARVLFGVAVGVSAFLVIRMLSRGTLAPYAPQWRIAPITDHAALDIHWRVMAIGTLFAVDMALALPVPADAVSAETRAVYEFGFDTAYAVLFLSLLRRRLWRFDPVEPSEREEERPSRIWPLLRVPMALIAVAVPVAALLSFHNLSRFLAVNLVVDAAVVAGALVVRGFAKEAISLLSDPESWSGQTLRRLFGLTERFAEVCAAVVLFLVDLLLAALVVIALLPLWGVRWDEVVVWIENILTGLEVGGVVISLTDVALGVAAFLALVALVRAIQRATDERVLRRSGMQVGLRDAVRAGIGYTGVIIAGFVAIGIAGIDLSSLAIIAGALSVGIGFGLQNVVNNFVSGLILLVERPIQVGDWVIVTGNEGIVKRISVRATEITTFQRGSVIIPNSTFLENAVLNWTHKDLSGRVEVNVGVAYGSDTEKVREVLLDVAEQHPKVSAVPQPHVVFLAFGESALEFVLWAYTADVNERFDLGSDLRFSIDHAFREHGIVIPFPQRDVHLIQPSDAGPDRAAPAAPEEEAPPARHQPKREGGDGE